MPYMPLLVGGPFDEAGVPDWMTNFWGKVIPVLSKRLQGHGKKFIAGTDRPTIADFKAFQVVWPNLETNPASCLSPATKQLVKSAMMADATYYRWVQSMCQEMHEYLKVGGTGVATPV